MYGLFEENGPVSVDNGLNLKKRKYAWTNKYNVLYLDPHTNCGFSYSDPTSRENATVEETSSRLQSAMRDFFKIFPDFKKRDLYLSGEFDSGAYMVFIGFWNVMADKSLKMNIKGLLVGTYFSYKMTV